MPILTDVVSRFCEHMRVRCLLTLAAVLASEDVHAGLDAPAPGPAAILGNSAGAPSVNTTADNALDVDSHKGQVPKASKGTTDASGSTSTGRSDSGKKADSSANVNANTTADNALDVDNHKGRVPKASKGTTDASGSTSTGKSDRSKMVDSSANVDASKKPSKGLDGHLNPHAGNGNHTGSHSPNSTHPERNINPHHGNLGSDHTTHGHGFPVVVLVICFLAVVLPISASVALIISSRRRAKVAAAEASTEGAADEGYVQGYGGLQAVPQEDD